MVIRLKGWAKIVLSILCLVIFFFFVKIGIDVYHSMMYPQKYAVLVEQYADLYQVDQNLVYAVIKTESGFQPNAVSENNAKGLMQITEDTFQWIGTKIGKKQTSQYVHDDMLRPEVNIMYGTYLLSYLLNEFHDYEVVLSAYHAGRTATNNWLSNQEYSSDGKTLEVIPYRDTNHYVDKVMRNYRKYQQLYLKK